MDAQFPAPTVPYHNLLQMQRETRSSIEVTRSAKGDYHWVIKCYVESESLAAMDEAVDNIQRIDERLRKQYL